MSEKTYNQQNRKVILNRARRYYHDNIEVLREKARNILKELSDDEEKKNRKIEHGRNRYHRRLEEARRES